MFQSEKDNLAVIVTWLDAMRRRDLEAVAALLDPDVRWRGVPDDAVCANPDEVLDMLEVAARPRASALELVAGDGTVILSRDRGGDHAVLVGEHCVDQRGGLAAAVRVAHQARAADLLVERKLVDVGDDRPAPDRVREVHDSGPRRGGVPVDECVGESVAVHGVARAEVVVADRLLTVGER